MVGPCEKRPGKTETPNNSKFKVKGGKQAEYSFDLADKEVVKREAKSQIRLKMVKLRSYNLILVRLQLL